MHPFLLNKQRISVTAIFSIVFALLLSSLISISSGSELLINYGLYVPLYILSFSFMIPSYYTCRGIPVEESNIVTLFGTQTIVILAAVSIWVYLGRIYVDLLSSAFPSPDWRQQFENTLSENVVLITSLNTAFALFHYLYFAIDSSRKMSQMAIKLELLMSQAELKALRSTIHPHFLFNALGTLSSVTMSDPRKAHKLCLALADFLRYSIAYGKNKLVTIADELQHIQNYLEIEQERFGCRLNVILDIEERVLSCQIPPLILFPLVENAIKHGIGSSIEGGEIEITARQTEGTLTINMKNPVDNLSSALPGEGHGLLSVERRLQANYGNESALRTELLQDKIFITRVYIPMTIKKSSNFGHE